MEHIETAADLIKWATEINQTIGQMNDHRRCELQDVYARSTTGQIDTAFLAEENKHARKLIICSVNNIMAFEEVERLLTVLANHKLRKQAELDEEEYQRRTADLNAREYAFRMAQKPIHKKIRQLKDRITKLEEFDRIQEAIIDRLTRELSESQKAVQDFAAKAGKYDAICKALLD